MPFLEEFAVGAALKVAEHAVDNRRAIWSELKCSLFLRRTRIRIAMSDLISIRHDGKYFLVQNLHRPYEFGPFGGVIKYSRSADILSEIGFEPHVIDRYRKDMNDDLRGFIQGKHFAAFLKWFAKGSHRESNCVMRELDEEIQEACDGSDVPTPRVPAKLPYTLVRTVHEPLRRPDGVDYFQYRLFNVYEVDESDSTAAQFIEELVHLSKSCKRLLLVRPNEIRLRRSGDILIGSHAKYLVDGDPRSHHPEPLPDC